MVRLCFDPELALFQPARLRGRPVEVRPDGTSTLGHVVEATGVPLTEVGALVVDGAPQPPAYRPRPGDLVSVQAVARPQPLPSSPARFLLDVHLGKLARRMRLLGLDVAYHNDADDDELIAWSVAEDRMLLTRDRGLLRRRALRHGAYVRGSRPDDQLHDVLDRFAPPTWPFSRCLDCNGRLAPTRKQDVVDLLQPGTRRTFTEFSRCAGCGRIYWRGAHARRLDEIVTGSFAGG